MEFNSKFGQIKYSETPWNDQVLNGKSLEIESIIASTNNELKILNNFCQIKAIEGYVLIATRISAASIKLKKIFHESGFIAIEHTFDISSDGMEIKKVEMISSKFPVIVESYTKDDIVDIKYLAENAFSYGRFYEDPYIEVNKARIRNKLWINDLLNQNAEIKVIKKKGKVVGFLAYKLKNNVANLILGCVNEKYRHLSYSFWANVILDLNNKHEIQTIISSSNVDIVNLYKYFGFKFENPRFGFHRHL